MTTKLKVYVNEDDALGAFLNPSPAVAALRSNAVSNAKERNRLKIFF